MILYRFDHTERYLRNPITRSAEIRRKNGSALFRSEIARYLEAKLFGAKVVEKRTMRGS